MGSMARKKTTRQDQVTASTGELFLAPSSKPRKPRTSSPSVTREWGPWILTMRIALTGSGLQCVALSLAPKDERARPRPVLTNRRLREIPVGEIVREYATSRGTVHAKAGRDLLSALAETAGPGRKRSVSDAHYLLVAETYQAAIQDEPRRPPRKAVADAMANGDLVLAATWVRRARERHFLPDAKGPGYWGSKEDPE
jgi:hypothetical protein